MEPKKVISDPNPKTSNQEETKGSPKKQEESKKKEYQPPNPKRFLNYTLTKDGDGFTIDDTDHVFYFEDDGGWYDEFENYYNADGEPDDGYDDYEPTNEKDLFGGYDVDGYDDDDYDPTYETYDNVYANQENVKRLESYLEDDVIKVHITNISFKAKMNYFIDYLRRTNKIAFSGEDYERYGYNGHKGSLYIICDNKKAAEDTIKLNGKSYEGRNLKVEVLKRDDAETGDDEDK
mmetsp:Transcript_33804/g.39307  ORF Transcript_33804/g.39307 Transcript_33804/m.39307 type:complete len:234 (-) Transcript_33804:258-959(-)|eukprot:CAMPEP_0176426434 /NCGR_PEP_ID=MMETSP0127-20121128/11942_1 /TAXON_ID=938130 /ORGANISM="Platyophrya macrostoma, Strain WH" /LENGTH=233 /DNA_ID=CAMNT_0017807705 /DNA_START=42 /DNA_END=743 /DNA_ORIENTATION=+